MKLKEFIGKDVRGYMDFHISFDDSLTFLIGINGSGKTTVLKLLSGLLYPAYIELAQIEFSYIKLTCEQLMSNTFVSISCEKKKDDTLQLIYQTNKPDELIKESFKLVDLKFMRNGLSHESFEAEKLARILFEFDNLSIVNKIRELRTPLFLGLNRRSGDNSISGTSFEREIFFARRRNPSVDSLFDSVDNALRDIQEMFHNFVRNNAQSQYALADRFRKKVFSESIKYERLNHISPINYSEELDRLDSRKYRLNLAIEQLEVADLSEQFSEFFESIRQTLEVLATTPSFDKDGQVSQEYIAALTQWMVNSSQLERIDNIIRYADEYIKNIQKSKEPLIRFVESANIFFTESNKVIEVDNKGEVYVRIKGRKKRNSIFELSSGEKQLIILLAYIAFHKNNKNASIFIVDEPELSLHISWQELFVDALLKASPNTQYILATHAPAIISKIERRNKCIDLTRSKF